MKLSDLELNLAAVDDGAWVDTLPDLEGVRVRVRGTDYKPYQKALRQALAGQGRKQRLQATMDVEGYDVLTRKLMAEHLVVAWDGIEDEQGLPVAATPALVMQVMTERRFRPLRDGILYAVNLVDSNLVEHREEAAGN